MTFSDQSSKVASLYLSPASYHPLFLLLVVTPICIYFVYIFVSLFLVFAPEYCKLQEGRDLTCFVLCCFWQVMFFVSDGMKDGRMWRKKGRRERNQGRGREKEEGNSKYHKTLLETWKKYHNCSIKKKVPLAKNIRYNNGAGRWLGKKKRLKITLISFVVVEFKYDNAYQVVGTMPDTSA